MSVTIRPRELGAIIRCGNCAATLATGQIQAKAIRAYATTQGWIRGLRRRGTAELPANGRADICPTCAPGERKARDERVKAAKERAALRNANRLSPEQRRERRNKLARERRAAAMARKTGVAA